MLRILAIWLLGALGAHLPLVAGGNISSVPQTATDGPSVSSVLPPDVAPGMPQRLRVRGCFPDGEVSARLTGLDVPVSLRVVDFFRTASKGGQDRETRAGSCELVIELTLPAGTPHGTNVALVVESSRGDSEPYPLWIAAAGRVVSESEPNDQFESAPSYPEGQIVRGSLATEEDEDVYRVKLLAGQTMRAQVWSARFGLPLDATLGLHDRLGMALMLMDDGEGTGADPVLEFQAPADGPVLLAVRRQEGSPWGETAAYLLDVEIIP
ncbi:MAG: hypothetical protein KIT22_01935 [Verrucomicrobiae bacterium]|nr:hypothetical protein [Verrucomicrobiae bacterium]